jgi:hypothetical protein
MLLERLRKMHPEPLMQLSTFDDVVGFRPAKDTMEDWLLASIPDLLRLALLVLPDRVNRDQLAWLGLTSKPELALRDLLGWLLQQSLPDGAAVAREWRRSDLAVLVEGEARAVIEGKAIYGFNALNPRKLAEYVGKVETDLVKAGRITPNAFTAAIVSVTTPITEWLPASDGAIGYAGNRRTTIAGVEVLDEVSVEVHRGLRQLGQVAEISLGTGVALGAQVATSLFFVRPTRGASTVP